MSAGKHSELSGLGNALSAREGLPTLPLDRQAFLNVQFVVNALTTCCGGALVQQVVVLHDVYLVWSGAPPPGSQTPAASLTRCAPQACA